MKKILLSLSLFILSITGGQAQNYVFRVMANNGSNLFKTVSSKEWSPVKRGVAFNSGDVVQIADQAYLGLIHKSGKTVELIDPGIFEIDDIALKIDVQKKGLGGKYTEFVMNTIDNESEYDDSEDLIVTRGEEKTLQVILPAASEVLKPKQILKWHNIKGLENETFVVNIKGIFDDLLLSEEVTTNEYLLDLEHPALKNERMFIVTVSLKGNEEMTSNEYAMDRIKDDKAVKYENELQKVMNSSDLKSPLDHMVVASYYEQNGLLVDAITHYHKAIELSPEVKDFKELFLSFINRHNINQ